MIIYTRMQNNALWEGKQIKNLINKCVDGNNALWKGKHITNFSERFHIRFMSFQ